MKLKYLYEKYDRFVSQIHDKAVDWAKEKLFESKIVLNGWLLQYKGTFFFIQNDGTLKSKISALRRFIKTKMLKTEILYRLNRGCFRTIIEADKIDSPLTNMAVVYSSYLFTNDGNIRPSENHILGGGGFVKLAQDTNGSLLTAANLEVAAMIRRGQCRRHADGSPIVPYPTVRALSGPVYIV